jgi:CheY-like chemotaxis protein
MRAKRASSVENLGVKSAAAIMHELRWKQKILLVGGPEFRRSLRASILRAHGLQVDVALGFHDGRSLSQQNAYDWVFLDIRSSLPGEVIDFCEQLRHTAPRPRIAFFVGPPAYVSAKWPSEQLGDEKEHAAAELKVAA